MPDDLFMGHVRAPVSFKDKPIFFNKRKSLSRLAICCFCSFFFQAPAEALGKEKLYDVVIIGGGLAGLSAAHELSDYDTVVLEKENSVGGRVLTREKGGVSYELGAVFRFDNPFILPKGGKLPEYIRENNSVAVHYKGKKFYCDNIVGCLAQLGLGPAEDENISAFRNRQCFNASLVLAPFSQETHRILNAFFRGVHSGEMDDYICARQQDLFITWPIEYYPGGNRTVVDVFKQSLSSKIELNAEVTSVEDFGTHVITTYRQGDVVQTILSKSVIVATPAPIAKKLLRRVNPQCWAFLNSVKYGQFTVVAVGLQDVILDKFSYIFTPDFLSTVILAKRSEDKRNTTLLVYYGDKESVGQSGSSDQAVIDRSIQIIHRLGIGDFTDKNISFTDIKRWEYGGTIISGQMFKGAADETFSRPSLRAFLAGDYVFRDTLTPYGMVPAVLSGRIAAQRTKNFLKTAQDSSPNCCEIFSIIMSKIPDAQSVNYLSETQPVSFGLMNNPAGSAWLERLDQRLTFGYDFFKVDASNNIAQLLKTVPAQAEAGIIGYFPEDLKLSRKELFRRMESLKKKFPRKRVLLGISPDLAAKLTVTDKLADFLALDISEQHFAEYLDGKYDNVIHQMRGSGNEVLIYIILAGGATDLATLEGVLGKAKSQQLQIGWIFNGNEKLFDFILQHRCILPEQDIRYRTKINSPRHLLEMFLRRE